MNSQTVSIIPAEQLVAVQQAREREALRIRQALIVEVNALISKWNPLDGPLELPKTKFRPLETELRKAGYAFRALPADSNYLYMIVPSLKTGVGEEN